MKLIINRQGFVVASHKNDRDIKDLYKSENLEFVRVPDGSLVQAPAPVNFKQNLSDEFGLDYEEDYQAPELDTPKDPRISWDLATAKANAKKVIPDIEEEYRAKIISPFPGKNASYRIKEQVARRILASQTPEAADAALFKFEADNRNLSITDLAKLVLEKVNKFNEISSFIDGASHKAEKIIEAQNSVEDSYKPIWKTLADLEQEVSDKIQNS